jgi:exopolyphosphatase / guanosine-5'-triphosphate,3'-diphosphate pyrophosphatase
MRSEWTLPAVEEVLRPFARLPVDFGHPANVARLAISLYDQMARLHRLGGSERHLLWCAGHLHDIGYAEGWQAHHKSAFRLIRATATPLLDPRENLMVACVARYHRGAEPKPSHEGFDQLGEEDRWIVQALASILRVADGLDRGQVGRVTEVEFVLVAPGSAEVRVLAPYKPDVEIETGRKKSAMLAEVFGLRLRFRYAGSAEITS